MTASPHAGIRLPAIPAYVTVWVTATDTGGNIDQVEVLIHVDRLIVDQSWDLDEVIAQPVAPVVVGTVTTQEPVVDFQVSSVTGVRHLPSGTTELIPLGSGYYEGVDITDPDASGLGGGVLTFDNLVGWHHLDYELYDEVLVEAI